MCSFETDLPSYQTQRSFVTWATIFTIVASVVYFLTVFFVEIGQTACPKRCGAKPEREEGKRVSVDGRRTTVTGMTMATQRRGSFSAEPVGMESMEVNPIHRANPTDAAMTSELASRMRTLKRKEQLMEMSQGASSRNVRAANTRTRREFRGGKMGGSSRRVVGAAPSSSSAGTDGVAAAMKLAEDLASAKAEMPEEEAADVGSSQQKPRTRKPEAKSAEARRKAMLERRARRRSESAGAGAGAAAPEVAVPASGPHGEQETAAEAHNGDDV